jgi:hypothetical protein
VQGPGAEDVGAREEALSDKVLGMLCFEPAAAYKGGAQEFRASLLSEAVLSFRSRALTEDLSAVPVRVVAAVREEALLYERHCHLRACVEGSVPFLWSQGLIGAVLAA